MIPLRTVSGHGVRSAAMQLPLTADVLVPFGAGAVVAAVVVLLVVFIGCLRPRGDRADAPLIGAHDWTTARASGRSDASPVSGTAGPRAADRGTPTVVLASPVLTSTAAPSISDATAARCVWTEPTRSAALDPVLAATARSGRPDSEPDRAWPRGRAMRHPGAGRGRGGN